MRGALSFVANSRRYASSSSKYSNAIKNKRLSGNYWQVSQQLATPAAHWRSALQLIRGDVDQVYLKYSNAKVINIAEGHVSQPLATPASRCPVQTGSAGSSLWIRPRKRRE